MNTFFTWHTFLKVDKTLDLPSKIWQTLGNALIASTNTCFNHLPFMVPDHEAPSSVCISRRENEPSEFILYRSFAGLHHFFCRLCCGALLMLPYCRKLVNNLAIRAAWFAGALSRVPSFTPKIGNSSSFGGCLLANTHLVSSRFSSSHTGFTYLQWKNRWPPSSLILLHITHLVSNSTPSSLASF
jgi:hypothetical protein